MATPSSNSVQLIIGGRVLGSLTSSLSGLNKQLGGLGTMATRVGGALAGLFAVQRLASFTSAAIQAADAIGKLAEKTGIGVNALAQLVHVAAQDDVEIGTLQTALKGLSQWLVKAGQAGKPLEQALLDQAEAFSKMEDGAAQAAFAVKVFGRAGLDMIPFLKRGPEGIRELMEEARRLGAVTAEQAAQADAWGDSLGNAKLAAEGLARSLAGPLLDAMTPIIRAMAEMVGALSSMVRQSKAAQAAILALVKTLGSLLAAFIALRAGRAIWLGLFGAGAIRSIKDVTAAIALVPAALRAVVNSAGVAAIALAAIWNAKEIGGAINSIEIFGDTIEQHITKKILEAERAWVVFQTLLISFGMGSAERMAELLERIAELDDAINTLAEDFPDEPPELIDSDAPRTAAQTAEELEKIRKLEADRVRYQIASLELAIKEATTDERRLELLGHQLVMADQLLTVSQARLDAADLATDGLEAYLKLEKEVLEAETDRFAIAKAILELNAEARKKAKEDAVEVAAARAQRLAEGRAVIGSTFTGQAARGFHDFREQKEAEEGAGVGGISKGAIAGLQNAMVQLGTAAQQVGQAISTVIGGAVQGVAGAIEGLIRRTMTWKDALVSVGMAILDSIIGAISQMLAQMLVGFLLQQLFGRLMEAQAKQLAGSWAAAAFFAAVATEGTAVAVGLGSLTAGLAAMQGMAAFAGGGFTGQGPKDQPVGIVHAGEYVIPARTVNEMGVHHFDALVAGGGSDSAPGRERNLNQQINLFLDRRAWMEANRDDIEAVAVDVMRRNAWRVQL